MVEHNILEQPQATWRLIVDPSCDGATNMAIDEAILESVGRGESMPTLRLYRWQPACLSLGYAQPAADADRERLAAQGWDIVRRMTGGRAILHTDELTYSVALPTSHPLVEGSIPDSYRRLSSALLAALLHIGLDAHADKQERRSAPVGPVCFEVPSNYEITAEGKKLIGSAQVRKANAALQHGSLPLYGDVSRICEVLFFADEAARQKARERVLRRATTLSEALHRTVEWDEAAQAVIESFAATFAISFVEGSLSPAEMLRAEVLRISQYAAQAWTQKL
ncbi:MAG: biotin/lipoate A/B protein ligase family protein [Chloroflexota bacterium]